MLKVLFVVSMLLNVFLAWRICHIADTGWYKSNGHVHGVIAGKRVF